MGTGRAGESGWVEGEGKMGGEEGDDKGEWVGRGGRKGSRVGHTN